MFKSRSGSQGHPTASQPQSIEAVRRRARHRLIGTAILVTLGAVGFSLLFDTQPRPMSADIPIVIPAKTPASALVRSEAPASTEAAVVSEKAAQVPTTVSARESLDDREEVVVSASPKAAAPVVKPEPQSEARREDAPQTPVVKNTVEPKPAVKPAAGNERIVVQVGAFAEATRAREARLKLERAGLKTYTHVAETPEGKRIRVRVGPFATKAEADKAATRIKALGLPAAMLWL